MKQSDFFLKGETFVHLYREDLFVCGREAIYAVFFNLSVGTPMGSKDLSCGVDATYKE